MAIDNERSVKTTCKFDEDTSPVCAANIWSTCPYASATARHRTLPHVITDPLRRG
jgi:hypothetical protein